jgi:pyruvate/2-oxoacid:ferredoxin oxidoreductase alpha subunit
MTVLELIERLEYYYNPNAEVVVVFDGGCACGTIEDVKIEQEQVTIDIG